MLIISLILHHLVDMSNQELIDTGRKQMDETDQAIERSKMVNRSQLTVATDKCIMFFLFLIVCGVIAIIIVKIVHPNNKNIRDIPGLAPPAGRKLLSLEALGN
ncbi:hypothetical protein BHM03_00040525 [Ensete ventricosum]|uniref:t-SNARE coiled-coil homology domain-containing protein n=1 Tax=Ensete ventricosum TaxID=4639 RepID=A0A445MK57_ENSVE|nr:hypothetical protein BHM03_00040525 [Ensete ventricosum]